MKPTSQQVEESMADIDAGSYGVQVAKKAGITADHFCKLFIIRHGTTIRQVRQRLRDERMAMAMDLLHRSYTRHPLTLKSIATKVGMKPNRLSYLFRRYFNCTFVECRNRMRINHAANLLAVTTLSVPAIAKTVGFTLLLFRREFRSTFGMTPRAYREQQARNE